MGVTGLWSILQPCARPTKIETLNRKRLAVDASIWIYQFLKAVRDKEGNALRNSHVVGFFRRICKLLFFGIKPVFVFDGGAPALKRSVIRERKRRREGRRDDAVRTAGKLLAVQMQRRAEEEEQKRREERDAPHQRAQEEEPVPDEGLVYVDELHMTQQERQQNRTRFKKKDAYHLPELEGAMNELGGPNDPRVMSLEELQSYARQFEQGEDINVYDFSKIDYDSDFFVSLPASDRYNILNAARLRSRLRMGYSKEQLDSMYPDRMAFSKFQIERVTERNELTQRLMHLNEGGDSAFGGAGRIAGEKGREYVLVKNDGVEGGWALGVVSNEGRSAKEAIDVDQPALPVKQESESEDEDFEDVAIEGLNRLPKRQKLNTDGHAALAKQRQALYKSRRRGTRRKQRPAVVDDPNSLFVTEDPAVEDEASEATDGEDELFGEDGSQRDEDEELDRAIALSMQKDDDVGASEETEPPGDQRPDEDGMMEVFQQSAVSEAQPVPKGSGRAIANIVNKRAYNAAPESQEITSFGVPVPKHDKSDGDDDDDDTDLQAALARSRGTKRKATPPGPRFNNVAPQTPSKATPNPERSATDIAKAHGFSGPLPFEKLDLGSSLLGKKKMQERAEATAGGFENPELAEKKKQKAEPLPPWFGGDLEEDVAKQREVEREDRQRAREFNQQYQFEKAGAPLRREETNEVIDLEGEGSPRGFANGEIVDLEKEIEQQKDEEPETHASQEARTLEEVRPNLGDVADEVRAEPPITAESDRRQAGPAAKSPSGPFRNDDSEDDGRGLQEIFAIAAEPPAEDTSRRPLPKAPNKDEDIEWSASEDEIEEATGKAQNKDAEPAGGVLAQASRSPSTDFEDVTIPDRPAAAPEIEQSDVRAFPYENGHLHETSLIRQETAPEEDFFDDFSDPEDEELLRSLAMESEEHARFESTLNNKSMAQSIADYEHELKQLRNQQKKDRRDADEVTHIMITECQQLLRLFGLPYITAPMEAEAQCAELVHLGLVDGIVTDDSDCFLFGGTRVYKNVFNQAKFVECYLSTDLEKEFDLTREKMISVAHLLGSDYTEGLSGIGPVTALEILAEFGSLHSFKEWWTGVQNMTISKEEDKTHAFRKKFRKNATKLFLPPAFPDERVNIAYLNPDVDASAEPFQWGVPDLDALRAFLMATIGWSQERTDEVLVPVIKDMNRRMDEGTQSNITAFFDGGVGVGAAGRGQRGEAFAPRKRVDASKRMGKAMGKLAEQAKAVRAGNVVDGNEEDVSEDPGEAVGGTESVQDGSARKNSSRRSAPDEPGDASDDPNRSAAPRGKGRKRKNATKPTRRRQQGEAASG